jgi:hypothetical protein
MRFEQDREINIIELMWEFFLQWKPAVLFSVLFGFLLMSFVYIKDVKSYTSDISSIDSPNSLVTTLKNRLTEDELQMVDDVLHNEKKLNSYVQKLPSLSQVDSDANKYNYICFRYVVESDASSFPMIIDVLEDSIFCNDFLSLLDEINPGYSDIASVTKVAYIDSPADSIVSYSDNEILVGSNDVLNKYTFSVNTLLLKGIDKNRLEKSITKYISDIDSKIQKILPHKSIIILSISEQYQIEPSKNTEITKFKSDVQELKKKVAADPTSFTDDQKELFYILSMDDIADSNESPITQPNPSAKNVLIGFAAGMLIYFFFIFFIYVLTGRVRSLDDVCSCYRTRGIGEVHERRFDTVWKRFMYSKKIYDIHYAKRKTSLDDHLTSVIDFTVKHAEHFGLKHITTVPAYSDTSEFGLCRKYTAALSKTWNSGHIPMDISKQITTKTPFDVPSDNEGMVILLHAGDTTFSTLARIFTYCQDYSIDIIGVILLED